MSDDDASEIFCCSRPAPRLSRQARQHGAELARSSGRDQRPVQVETGAGGAQRGRQRGAAQRRRMVAIIRAALRRFFTSSAARRPRQCTFSRLDSCRVSTDSSVCDSRPPEHRAGAGGSAGQQLQFSATSPRAQQLPRWRARCRPPARRIAHGLRIAALYRKAAKVVSEWRSTNHSRRGN